LGACPFAFFVYMFMLHPTIRLAKVILALLTVLLKVTQTAAV
jgi:hypothetical protein